MIKVIDDFVNPAYSKGIESAILGENFPWIWCSNISDQTAKSSKTSFGFTHKLVNETNSQPVSDFYQFLLPMFLQALELTNASGVIRARGDMTVFSGKQITYEPHIDMQEKNISVIFYVNDSDGDTIIYKEKYQSEGASLSDPSYTSLGKPPNIKPVIPKTLTEEERVTPKANRLLLFNGEHWHTGQSPTKHSRRVLINFNLGNSE